MASIQKRGAKWRAFVFINGARASRTFSTKKEARAWADDQEQNGLAPTKTLRDAIAGYEPIAMEHKGAQSELSRLRQLSKIDCIDLPLQYVTPEMLAKYRDRRLKEVAPVSVRRELIILGAILRVARDEWGWIRESPLSKVRRPETSKPRRRGVKQSEIDAIIASLNEMRVGPQVGAMFRLSIETGMRLAELCGLRWLDVSTKTVTLPETKNGDRRQVPLSVAAREIVKTRRGIDPDRVFTLSPHVASKTFQRARTAAGCDDVHFHDARSEAITRLSKKLDVLQLARVIGHRDIKNLMIYYAESADDTADRL